MRNRVYRAIWASGFVSSVGWWMQGLGAAWLMTSLDPSPFMVGMIFAAQSIPAIFLAPFIGALADMFDRRNFLVTVAAWQVGTTLLMAGLTLTHLMTPWLLIGFILMLGFGAACQNPAMLALTQDILPREELTSAATLNSISVNISRVVGPATAGMLVGLAGEGAVFLMTSLTYLAFLLTIMIVIKSNSEWSYGSESLFTSTAGGLRYARKAKRFQGLLIRTFAFFFAACINAALLPLVARQELHVGPDTLGLFLGTIGGGAIVGTVLLAPYLNARYTRDQIMMSISVTLALTLIGIGATKDVDLFVFLLFLYGGTWMIALVELQVASQMVLPAWVRGRGLSLNAMGAAAGATLGSMLWGFLAEHVSMAATFAAAALTLTLAAVSTHHYKISSNEPDEV
jgi:MFS family permease